MKTSRLESTNGFPRHVRQNRLLRKLLKAHHAATYDRPAPSHSVQTEKKEIEVPEIHVTPPPPYHDIARDAPAVREVPRFRPTVHPDLCPAHSVASLGTTILANVPLLSPTHDNPGDMDLRRCASATTLLPRTTYQPAPVRHHRSADNLLTLATTSLTPASPLGSHPVDPSSPTTASSLTDAEQQQPPPARQRRRTAAKPPSLKRASSYPLISVSIMTPIREEPRSPCRPPTRTTTTTTTVTKTKTTTTTTTTATAAVAAKRLPSILRASPAANAGTAPRRLRREQQQQKRVRFSPLLTHDGTTGTTGTTTTTTITAAADDDETTSPTTPSLPHDGNSLALFATAVLAASLLLLLAFADEVAGLMTTQQYYAWEWAWEWSARVEYALAFAVGCGVAHWLAVSGVADVVGGTLGRAREEGWV
ncbi:hypothetical protein SLS58_008970 [Diplodia intermedia]|uniref:Uncharacterized protein n=1 Tax=Diplodia intermedia TaxID=856260 RepID=A0ABR3TFE6_9PEZI